MPRRFWIAIGILLLVIIAFVGWSISRKSPMTTSSPPSVVQPSIPQPIARIGAVSGRWTKDGKAIFFVKNTEVKDEIFRYDLASQQITRYTVVPFGGGFDISPDERSIVFTDTARLYIAELNTSNKRTIYTSPHLPTQALTGQIVEDNLKWLPTGFIHFYMRSPAPGFSMLLNIRTNKTQKLTTIIWFLGTDGTVCIYNSNEDGYPSELYLYNIASRTSQRLLDFPSDFNFTNDLLYLTKDKLIYRYYPLIDGARSYDPEFYHLDLHTMKRERWRDLPVDSFILNISPDLRHYFILAWGRTNQEGFRCMKYRPSRTPGLISARLR